MALTRSQTSNQSRALAPVKKVTNTYNLRPLPSRTGGNSASVAVRTVKVTHGYNLRPRH